MTQLRRIVVAIKPWQRGLPVAAAHARQLAQSVGAELRLVSTVYDAGIAARGERGDKAAVAAREHTIAGARLELERLAQSLRDWGATITTQVVWGSPVYECVLAVAREWRADLLVVGVHEGVPAHVRLTDTDWELMRHVGCPLLLVKDPQFDGYRTVLAAVDPLHAHAEPYGLDRAVLDAARTFTGAFASRLRVVNAYAGAAAYELASAVEVAPGMFYGAENVEAVHRRAVVELAQDFGVAGDAIDLVAGRPAEVIIDSAAEHDAALVVVGVPQRRGRLAVVVGSTAEIVAAELTCDVLLVPAPPR